MTSRKEAAKNAIVGGVDRDVVRFTGDEGEGEGAEVYGKLRSVKTGLGSDGDVDLIEVDDDERGGVTVFLSAILYRMLVEADNNIGRPAEPGDTVYIRFEGQEPLEGGRTLNQFAVYLEAGNPRAEAAAAATSGTDSVPPPEEDDEEVPF